MHFVSQTIYLNGKEISPEVLMQNDVIKNQIDKTTDYIKELSQTKNHPDLAFERALLNDKEVASLQSMATNWSEKFKHLVVLGTGGSSIGGQALCSILKYKQPKNQNLEVKFLDNLSHHQMESLFEGLNLSKTHFLVISKSGHTSETLAQCLVSMEAVRTSLNSTNIQNYFTVIVQPGNSPLRKLAVKNNFQISDHNTALGGRYSALSNVGLTPAISMGFDASLAIKAAKSLYKNCLNPDYPSEKNTPLIGASIQAYLIKKGISQSILMPYESRLIDFTRWYQQLWAESLGKCGKGTTPFRALGPLDQHSQLQLFLDGPKDKIFTFLIGNAKNVGFKFNEIDCEEYGLNYLANNTIGDLVHAEANASIDALVERGIPIRVLRYETLDEDFIGELMAHFFLETLFMAKMINVDPFGQPAVERAKILTREYLSKTHTKNEAAK